MRTLWISLVVAAFLPLAAQAKDAAETRTDNFIAALKKVKQNPSAAERAANEKVFNELDGFIDFDTLTSEAIKPRAEKFTPAQRAEYAKKFRELIRLIAYPDSGAFFKEAALKFKPAKTEGNLTNVAFTAKAPGEPLETEVTLHWAGGQKLVDVSFDGESLVKDYQNQFTRIIDKNGVAGLIKKLDERRAALDKGAAAGKTAGSKG